MSIPNVCPSCGTSNAPSNLFCTNCGKPLSAPTTPHAYPPAAAPPPAYPSPPTYPSPPAYPGPPAYPPPGAYPGAYPYVYAPPRQATFSSILGAMFDVWTQNFVNFFLTFLVVALVEGLVFVLMLFALSGRLEFSGGFASGFAGPLDMDVARLILFLLLAAVAGVIIDSIVVGGMTEYAVRRHRGESMALGQALRRGLDRFLSILGANILIALLIAAIIIVPAALIFVGIASSGGAPAAAIGLLCGGLLALVVGGIFAIYVLVATNLFAPAIMMENQDAIGGLTRSWELTKGYRWSLFGAILVAGILSGVISWAITFPASLVQNVVVDVVAFAVVTGLVGSWTVILAAVAYDLIVRTPTYGPPPYFGPTAAPPASGPMNPPPATPPPGP